MVEKSKDSGLARKVLSGSNLFLLIVSILCLVLAWSINSKKVKDAELGFLALKYLYNFSSVGELNSNMDLLREITSSDVYEKLTIDNTDRSLNVYLKFKGNPTYVVPERSTDKYIIYHLLTKTISESRKFVFFFDVDGGKIVNIRESEIIDFVTTP